MSAVLCGVMPAPNYVAPFLLHNQQRLGFPEINSMASLSKVPIVLGGTRATGVPRDNLPLITRCMASPAFLGRGRVG